LTPSADIPHRTRALGRLLKRYDVLIVGAAVCTAAMAVESPRSLVFLILNGVPAAMLFACMTLAGVWTLRPLGLAKLESGWQIVAGAGMGCGLTTTLVLVLGCVGLLGRELWSVVLAMMLLAAVATGVRLICQRRRCDDQSATAATRGRLRRVWWVVTPFVVLSLSAALTPPGFLWQEEGSGYDVLEYHLELPKEYLQSGEIAYTPHNVYGSFPANVEMLSLLSMIVMGDPYDGAAVAKLFNPMFAAVMVLAAVMAGRRRSRRAGLTTGVLTATVGWLTYLSGIAYVENAMLMFAMIATAAVLRSGETDMTSSSRLAWIRLAGLMCGFCCGCKYTAVLLVAMPLLMVVVFLRSASIGERLKQSAAFCLMTLLAFSPWLIRNTVTTGDPVFPIASSLLGAYPPGWGATEAEHFRECHQPSLPESSLTARLARLWSATAGDPSQRFGPLVLLLAASALVRAGRTRHDVLLGAMLLLQIIGWMTATHLFSRFTVPMIVPLVLLGGGALDRFASMAGTGAMVLLVVGGAVFNGLAAGKLHVEHFVSSGRRMPLEGAERFFIEGIGGGHEHLATINRRLPTNAKILLVGDAKAFYFQRRVDYCVVFNRNPFVEVVRTAKQPADVVAWLRQKGYTHVLVNWGEIRRLRRSRYGFAKEITPELFKATEGDGLVRVETFSHRSGQPPYATLYRVTP